ncbi:MAG TPA: CPBP family glutamic-type intramembrane protease [Candidatus Hydrogenedentes bacterium]|nr:CPBP family glutamic-type intramembrane protease [Candidatus Hydrogenedentota bacterium]
MEHWAENRVVYDGRVVRLRVGDVTLDNGDRALREVVEHPGGVCILPFTGHSVVLVRQYRIAVEKYVLEAPAGKLEGEEDPETRARLELEEETGLRAGCLVPVSFAYASVGYCNERIHLYLALDLEKTACRPDPDERIELVEVPLDEAREMLAAHAVHDGKTIILLYALLQYLDRQQAHAVPEEARPAAARKQPFPGVSGAIGLVLLALAVQVFLAAGVHLVGELIERPLLTHPLSLGLMNLLSMAVPLAFGLALLPWPWRGVFGRLRFAPGLIVPAALAVFGLHFVFSEISNYMLQLVEPSENALQFMDTLIGESAPVWATALTLVVLAPIGEELLFRGLILHGLRARYNAVFAVVTVSLLFAVLHLNIWQAPGALGAGLLFGWWRLRAGSIGLCIFGHAVLNGLGLIGGRLLPWEIPGYNADPISGMLQPWWLTACGAALAVISMVWLAVRFRNRPKTAPEI